MQWSVDHIVPVKHHGLDHWCNYCLMPQRVNSAFGKHAVAKGGVPKHWVVGQAVYKSAVRFHAAWMRLTLGEVAGDQAAQEVVVSRAAVAEPVLDWPALEVASWQAQRTAAARRSDMAQRQQQQQDCACSHDLNVGQQQMSQGYVAAGAADVRMQSPAGDALPVEMTNHASVGGGQPGASHPQAGVEQCGSASHQDEDQLIRDLVGGASITHPLPSAQLQQAASGNVVELVQEVNAFQQSHTQAGRWYPPGRSTAVFLGAAPVVASPQQDELQSAASSQEAGSGLASPSDSHEQATRIVNPFDRFRRLTAGVG